jgi:hypothetical protein
VQALAFVTRVQGSEEVQHLTATDLTDHEAVRAHPQRLSDQVA